jgi:hypothetical protein
VSGGDRGGGVEQVVRDEIEPTTETRRHGEKTWKLTAKGAEDAKDERGPAGELRLISREPSLAREADRIKSFFSAHIYDFM